jgi:uncharacterized protein with NAD-binding domain and iron-sulfur cluster
VFAVVVRRYDGWALLIELQDSARVKDLRSHAGIDYLLYSADTYFGCFADLALTGPALLSTSRRVRQPHAVCHHTSSTLLPLDE